MHHHRHTHNTNSEETGLAITWIGMVVNILLTGIKTVIGIISGSSALIADGLHSLGDLLSDVATIIGIRISTKPGDSDHNYGHGKFETLASLFTGALLLSGAGAIIWNSSLHVFRSLYEINIHQPAKYALYAALGSIVLKEAMFWSTINIARRTNSMALRANAWHHRSDSLSSVASALGIGGAILLGPEWNILDPAAAAVVGVLILKAGFNILKESLSELVEASLSDEEKQRIKESIEKIPGASAPHNLRARRIGRNNIALEVHVNADPSISMKEAHTISSKIEHNLIHEFGEGSFFSIHMEPSPST